MGLMNVISLIASIFSIIALPITLYQLWQVKDINEHTQEAIESTRKDMQRIVSIHDVAKYIQCIDSILQDIKTDKWELVFYRMTDLKSVLIDLSANSFLHDIEELESFKDHISQIGIDITNINRQILGKSTKSLRGDKISENLIKISNSLSIVRSKVINL